MVGSVGKKGLAGVGRLLHVVVWKSCEVVVGDLLTYLLGWLEITSLFQ